MDFESGFVLNYQYGFILKERLNKIFLMSRNLFYMSLPLLGMGDGAPVPRCQALLS